MNEIEGAMKELDNLYHNYVEAWPNENLRLAANDFIIKYEEGVELNEWEAETAVAIANLVNSRIEGGEQ